MDIVLIAFITILIGFICGRYSRKTVTLTDNITIKSWTSETRMKQQAVMQLQNEIAASGAIKMTETEDGYNVKLTVVI